MDLQKSREKINEIDEKLVQLFVERMQLAAEIAEVKAEKNLPVQDLKREQAVLESVAKNAGAEFERYVNQLYRTIFEISKSYQAGILSQRTALAAEILQRTNNMEFPKRQ